MTPSANLLVLLANACYFSVFLGHSANCLSWRKGVVCSFPAILSCFFGLPPIVSLARRVATSPRRKVAGLVCPCPRCGGSCDHACRSKERQSPARAAAASPHVIRG